MYRLFRHPSGLAVATAEMQARAVAMDRAVAMHLAVAMVKAVAMGEMRANFAATAAATASAVAAAASHRAIGTNNDVPTPARALRRVRTRFAKPVPVWPPKARRCRRAGHAVIASSMIRAVPSRASQPMPEHTSRTPRVPHR